MSSEVEEQRAALEHLLVLLDQALDTAALAWRAHRGAPEQEELLRHLDALLDRHARLFGIGLYENNTTAEIFESAVHTEVYIAGECLAEAERTRSRGEAELTLRAEADLHLRRARAIINASRRAPRLRVPRMPSRPDPYRGVFIEPAGRDIEDILRAEREHYIRHEGGLVALIRDSLTDALRASGARAQILYLSHEALEAASRGPDFHDALRSQIARSAADLGVAEPFAAQRRRLLLHQNHVLRNLVWRCASEYTAARRALEGIHRELRELVASALAAGQDPPPTEREALRGRVRDEERAMVEFVTEWIERSVASHGPFSLHFQAALPRGRSATVTEGRS